MARYRGAGTPPGEHPGPLLLFAHHLGRILPKARRWCVPTSDQLEWLGEMQGEAGERLRGRALAGASDVPVTDKIAHIAGRLLSSAATAEDLALITDILSSSPAPGDLAAWSEALGTPSPAPADGGDQIPRDWARAWRWAAVLPASVLTAWRDAVDYVSGVHGVPDPQALTGDRPPPWVSRFGRSPYNAEELSARPPAGDGRAGRCLGTRRRERAADCPATWNSPGLSRKPSRQIRPSGAPPLKRS
jgi:hypothetical protein